jgi:Tfp pilus assembly protein PilF/peroxiredoxin
LTIRLTGVVSNRDAIGARVTVETDRMRRSKYVQAGSGFISQHSRELHFGLGASEHVRTVVVDWPSGQRQELADVPINSRLRLVEGGTIQATAFDARPPAAASPARTSAARSALPDATWLYEPFPAPEFSVVDIQGKAHSLAGFRGRPAVLLFWSPEVSRSREALAAVGAGYRRLSDAGISALAIALDAGPESVRPRDMPAGVPVAVATREVALSFAIVNRHVYMNRQDLLLPSLMLIDPAGRVVKIYRSPVDAATIVHEATRIDVAPEEWVARAVPFQGTFHTPLPMRNYLPYGRELLDQGLESQAVTAFERAAEAQPTAPTLYRLGTLLVKSGEPARARTAFERALTLQPDLAEANNDLGTLLAQDGDLDGAIGRFRAALAATPEYPDALNNLGYALLLTGQDQEARALYEKALALQPDFPEALNNLGLLFGRAGELDKAERYFRDALEKRDTYGEAANNLALVLVARGRVQEAIDLLDRFIAAAPEFDSAYITLAKIHLGADRAREGLAVLERLLQRNPTHPVALELVRNWKPAP